MSAQLFKSLHYPRLANLVSFSLIVAFFFGAFLVLHKPLSTAQDFQAMPRWAPLAGLTGAIAVYAGLGFYRDDWS